MKTKTALDEFTRQYIETALWSSTDLDEYLDENYGIDDLAPETLEAMIEDCQKFQRDNWKMIEDNLSQAGHDFWLTRQNHGAGFWDGDWPEHGDELTEACRPYGVVYLYVGDDGKIYQN